MKRILTITLVGGILFSSLVIPIIVSAQEFEAKECCVMKRTIEISDADPVSIPKGDSVGPTPEIAAECGGANKHGSAQWGLYCLLNSVYNVSNWIFYFIMVITVVMVAIGAFMYVSSAGDPEKAGKGQKLILYAVIGIAIAFFARAVPALVKFVMAI